MFSLFLFCFVFVLHCKPTDLFHSTIFTQCHIYQGNEPSRFFPMFQSLVVFKGGLSRRYKMFLVEKENKVEEANENKASLFRVQGTSPRNMQAIQVNLVGSFILSAFLIC